MKSWSGDFRMSAAAVIRLSSTLVSRVWRARHRARGFYHLLPTGDFLEQIREWYQGMGTGNSCKSLFQWQTARDLVHLEPFLHSFQDLSFRMSTDAIFILFWFIDSEIPQKRDILKKKMLPKKKQIRIWVDAAFIPHSIVMLQWVIALLCMWDVTHWCEAWPILVWRDHCFLYDVTSPLFLGQFCVNATVEGALTRERLQISENRCVRFTIETCQYVTKPSDSLYSVTASPCLLSSLLCLLSIRRKRFLSSFNGLVLLRHAITWPRSFICASGW